MHGSREIRGIMIHRVVVYGLQQLISTSMLCLGFRGNADPPHNNIDRAVIANDMSHDHPSIVFTHTHTYTWGAHPQRDPGEDVE